ncbi:MAG: DMT family transporter [Gemmatimonadaceae bacterium]|nr:DMT family transporter [Gemmatimonadaceae bacterium]
MTGVLWIVVAETLFAIMRLATRANALALPWAALAATRFLGGAAIVFGVAQLTRGSLRIRDRRATWLRALFGTGSSIGVFYALGSHRISVGDATTLAATAPLFVAALSRPLLGEAVTRRVMLGILLGFAGVVTLVGPSFGTSGNVALIALAGAASYAMAMVYLRKVGPGESSEAVALHVSLVAGGFAAFVFSSQLAAGTVGVAANPVDLVHVRWWALGVAALAGGLSQIALTRAYSLDRAARLGAVSYIGVVLTYALEAIVMDRAPTLTQLVGAGLVVAAGLLTVTSGPDAQLRGDRATTTRRSSSSLP